jgi:PqqD family protein of HPr-rel-A system
MDFDQSRLRDLALSDSGFVFDPLTGHTFTVNAAGLTVLRALKDGQTKEGLAARLAAEFEPEGGEDIGRDVEEFLSSLKASGLLK